MAEYFRYSLKTFFYCCICLLPWGFLFEVAFQVLLLSSLDGISVISEQLRG